MTDTPPAVDDLIAERDRLTAYLQREVTEHMRFGMISPDGTTEMLPCPDWCHACKLTTAEAERDRLARELERAKATIARVRALAEADGRFPCRGSDWREPGEVDGDWDVHLADAVLAVLSEHGKDTHGGWKIA